MIMYSNNNDDNDYAANMGYGNGALPSLHWAPTFPKFFRSFVQKYHICLNVYMYMCIYVYMYMPDGGAPVWSSLRKLLDRRFTHINNFLCRCVYINIYIYIYICTCRIQNPDIERAGWVGAAHGGAGPGRAGRRRIGSPKRQPSPVTARHRRHLS